MRARSETPTTPRPTSRPTPRATPRATLRTNTRTPSRAPASGRSLRIASLVAALIVLCPIVASACEYCAESGFLRAECEFPRNWWQWSFAYENCSIIERCFLGICISFCRTSVTCYADIAPDGLAGGEAEACRSESAVYVLA